MSIDGTVSSQIFGNDRRTVGLATAANIGINLSRVIAFADGVGAAAANILYQDKPALSSGTYSLDLFGAVADSYGDTVNAVRVKALYVKNNGADPLVVGGDTNAALVGLNDPGTLTLPPGAWFLIVTPDAGGWPVTDSTADTLLFTGTGAETFDVIVLAGAS